MSEPTHAVEFAAVITGASWEPRFVLGLERVLQMAQTNRVLVLRYQEFTRMTDEAVRQVRTLCTSAGVHVSETELSYTSPERTWERMRDLLTAPELAGRNVLVDLSTMPREAIWSAFSFLERARAVVWYVYHRPQSYAEWLTKNPLRPRLVLQMSGESQFGRDTVLLATTGFHRERTEQLIRVFDPSLTLLGMQEGEQFGNESANVDSHQDLLTRELMKEQRIRDFRMDAYASDHGLEAIKSALMPHQDSANIILASGGPKLSAVAIYRYYREHPEVALAYAPCSDFNPSYSAGLGNTTLNPL
jgi:hypothetical protein